MGFQTGSVFSREHLPDAAYPADMGFVVTGNLSQQLAVHLPAGFRLVGKTRMIIAHDRGIEFEDAGNDELVMAHNATEQPARLVLSPGGCIGAFDLRQYAGRILLPQESFLAAGPGVRLRPYSHIRSLVSEARPNGLVLLQADGAGWVFTGATGEVSCTHLPAGETMAVRSCAIAALGATVIVDATARKQAQPGYDALRMALLRGPGAVWLQSSNPLQASTGMLPDNLPAQKAGAQLRLPEQNRPENPPLQ